MDWIERFASLRNLAKEAVTLSRLRSGGDRDGPGLGPYCLGDYWSLRLDVVDVIGFRMQVGDGIGAASRSNSIVLPAPIFRAAGAAETPLLCRWLSDEIDHDLARYPLQRLAHLPHCQSGGD